MYESESLSFFWDEESGEPALEYELRVELIRQQAQISTYYSLTQLKLHKDTGLIEYEEIKAPPKEFSIKRARITAPMTQVRYNNTSLQLTTKRLTSTISLLLSPAIHPRAFTQVS